MKAVLLVLASLVFVVCVFLSGMFVTAYMIAEPEPHKFAHLDTPDLWTAKPVKVDENKGSYERLPSAPVVTSVPASDLPDRKIAADANVPAGTVDNTTTGSVGVAASGAETASASPRPAEVVDTARADWCFARYRSYRIEDNTYQPLSGGPRRQCESPDSGMQQTASATRMTRGSAVQKNAGYGLPVTDLQANEQAENRASAQDASFQSVSDGGQSGSHEDWCSARYKSYRVEDNSYQPFDGGPRRSCESPFG